VVGKQILTTLMTKVGGNFLTNNKKNMTGIMNCKSSRELHFHKVKACSKYLGITINDLVMSALSVAFKRLFKEYNDINEKI